MSRFKFPQFSPIHLVISWYLTVVFSLLFCSILFLQATLTVTKPTPIKLRYQLYQSLPSNALQNLNPQVSIEKQDGRALIIKNFFQSYGAPLATYAQKFVEVADKYQLDYKLLPAIAMQESSGGKSLPDGSYNPFGYGIYGDQVKKFNDFSQAIETVGLGMRKNYIDQGLTSPDTIMPKYTPPSVEKGGPWAIGVSTFMEELR